MTRKKSSVFLRIAVLASAVYCVYTLLSLQVQINGRRDQLSDLEAQLERQQQTNVQISMVIEGEIDPHYMEQIARDRLGLAMPNEKIFINPNGMR